MRLQLGLAFQASLIALVTLVAGCSSSQDKAAEGSLSVKLSASHPAAPVEPATATDDPLGHLLAASVTISEMEARRTDGTWLTLESGFPKSIDLVALARGGASVALPADLLREGQHNALQVRIARVELTLTDGGRVTLDPPGTAWSVLIPIDFGVVTDRETVVSLIVRLDRSIRLVNGQFEFDPEMDVAGIERG